MNVFELAAKLSLDTSEYESSLGSAEEKSSSFGSTVKTALSAGAAVVTATTAAAGAAVAGVTKLTSSTAEYGDNIDKASQKLGVSSSFYQEWDAVLQHSGTSMSSMTSTFKTLANASQDASDDQVAAFEKLGLSMDEVSQMSTEDLFTSVISGLQGMEEGTERTALATDLLGKGATEMGALLNTSAEDTQSMIDTVNELGGVMSEDAVKDAAAYEDSLQDMQTAFSGIKNSIGADLLPVFTDLMNMVTENMPVIQETIQPIIESIGGWITDIATWISEHGTEIENVFSMIADALSTAWGGIQTILDALKGAFQTVTDALGENGTSMEDVWNGLGDTFSAVVEVISGVITVLGEAIAWLVTETQTDGTLLNTVWENVQTVCDTVFSAVGDVIQFFIDLLNGDFSGALQDAWDFVDDVFGGIWEIIDNNLGYVWDTVSTVFGDVYDWIEEKMGDASDFISGIIDDIKGFFDFDISWPSIPMPHFSISPEGWKIGDLLSGSIPSLSISWYAKAMDKAQVLSGATIFGASGGSLLGGGEKGNEVVSGEDHLVGLINKSVSNALSAPLTQIGAMLQQYLPDIASKDLVMPTSTLADAAEYEIQRRANRRSAAFA